MTGGFVYILRPRFQIEGQEVIKIGMTTRSVQRRVKELSTGSHHGFDIVYTIQVDNARWFEKTLHKRYEDFRCKGGGQEFFRVPARNVIIEIEKIATEISQKRAREARNEELKRYKKEIGAASAEAKLMAPFIIAFPAVWAYIYYLLVVKIGVEFFRNHQLLGILTALSSIYVLPVVIWQIGSKIYEKAHKRFVWSQFGIKIEQKERELRRKYPLAYF